MKSKPLAKLMDATKLLAKWTGNERIELQTVQTLLTMCLHGGEMPQQELEKALDMGQSSVSRNIARLGIGSSPDDPGPRLMVAEEDPYYRRRKIVKLTERGRRFCDELSTLMEK